ncbi:MAG TPA: ABC transporter permease, partial [bacterium]|nr:ABC transporter permease [bacterium]
GVARWLPFAFSAYWPAYTMVSGSPRAFVTGLAGVLVYAVVLGAVAALLFALGRRRVHVQGG